jgi:hypothetical protein
VNWLPIPSHTLTISLHNNIFAHQHLSMFFILSFAYTGIEFWNGPSGPIHFRPIRDCGSDRIRLWSNPCSFRALPRSGPTVGRSSLSPKIGLCRPVLCGPVVRTGPSRGLCGTVDRTVTRTNFLSIIWFLNN